jgi:hypothetical protein
VVLLLADFYLQQAIYTVLCINVVGIAIFLLEKVPERIVWPRNRSERGSVGYINAREKRRSGLRPSDNKLPEQRSGNSVTKIPLAVGNKKFIHSSVNKGCW